MAIPQDVALFDPEKIKTGIIPRAKQHVASAASGAYRSGAATKASPVDSFTFDMAVDAFSMDAYKNNDGILGELPVDAAARELTTEAMTIAANNMSREDFARMLDEGFEPYDLNVKETVTVMDKIKAGLAEAGVTIEGLNDDLSAADLEGIISNPALAMQIARKLKANDMPVTPDNIKQVDSALQQARELKPLDENTLKYMINRKLSPTLSNVYLAQHATAAKDDGRQIKGMVAENGYYTRKAEDFDWENLRPQMEKIIRQAGLELSVDNMEDAKWFIEKSIPLTAPAFSLLKDIKGFKLPSNQEEFMDTVVKAMADGRKAKNASLSIYTKPFIQTARSAYSTINQAQDENLKAVIAAEKDVNIKNLQNDMEISVESPQRKQLLRGFSDDNSRLIAARRQLEEVRLMMTVSANMRLLRSGVHLETAPLEDLVGELKNLEAESDKIFFQTNDPLRAADFAALYKDVIKKCEELREMPSSLVGKLIAYRDENGILIPSTHGFTIRAAYGVGAVTMSNMKLAGLRYETLMTEVRADLGDSPAKISNIDSLIESEGLELNDETRRAVKILGANTMPINSANIQAVSEADALLQRTLDAMTPEAVLKLIRGGFDPLTMEVPKLHDFLMMMDDTPKQKMEDYAKFLFKLEKSGEISQEEKKGFIGVYKMVRLIEHSEGAAVGGVINRGEMTFSKLVTATRNLQRKSKFNVTVDNDTTLSGNYKEPEKNAGKPDADISRAINGEWDRMQYLKDKLDQLKADPDLEDEYIEEQYKDFLRMEHTEEEVVATLERYGEKPSAENLVAAQVLMMSRGFTFSKIFEKCMGYDEKSLSDEYADEEESEGSISEELTDKVYELHEALADPRKAKKEYASFTRSLQVIIDRLNTREDDYSGMKQNKELYSQIRLANRLAQKENYEVPVIINDKLTSVNLRIITPQNTALDGGTVNITMETEDFGKIAASFVCRGRTVMGYLAATSEKGYRKSLSMEQPLTQQLVRMGFPSVRVDSIKGTSLDLATFAKNIRESANEQTEVATTVELYKVARTFIGVLQD